MIARSSTIAQLASIVIINKNLGVPAKTGTPIF